MSKIDVDLDKLKTVQREIDSYIDILDAKLYESTKIVEQMNVSWKGKDYDRFKNKWTELTNSSSIAITTKKELELVKSYIYACNQLYTELQKS